MLNPLYVQAWIKAFIISLILEIPIFVVIARWPNIKRSDIGFVRPLIAAGIGTCITHPVLWFVLRPIIANYTVFLIIGELQAILIETLVFYLIVKKISLLHAFIASLTANEVVCGIGFLLYFFKILK